MIKKARKFLCLLIMAAMLIGVIPTSAIAAEITDTPTINTLKLDEEQIFVISKENNSATFTFTAPEEGTYIVYFKNISQWPIGLQSPAGSVQYHCFDGNGDFQGHVLEMAAGESISITFLYPEGEFPEDYNGYSGIVGVGKKADTLSDFYALEKPDSEGIYSFTMTPQFDMNFFVNDPLCYGVIWEITVENEEIFALDKENSRDEKSSFSAVFVPKQPGKTSVTVSATYEGTTITKTYQIRITEESEGGGQQQGGDFSSFEELKELVSSSNGEEGSFNYTGTEQLVITEDIEINGYIYVPYSVGISGVEHIQFAQEWQQLVIQEVAESALSLVTLLEEMNETHIDNEHVQYYISVQSDEDLILEQSISIPDHVCVAIGNMPSFTVAEGVSITSDGELQMHTPFTVAGTLVNNGFILISHTDGDSGQMIMSSGSYSGSGNLQIIADAGTLLEDILDNSDDFDVLEELKEEGRIIWVLKYAGGLIKLGTPTELSWGTRYEDMGENEYSTTPQPGIMSWKTVLPDQARASVKIYDASSDECVFSTQVGFDPQYEPEYRSLEDFLINDFNSGTYYFTAQSLGDYETYRSSDIAVSGTYTYVKPSKQLNTCTELYWTDRNDQHVKWAHFTLPENEIETVGFELAFYYSPEEDGEYERFGGMSSASPYGAPDNEMPLEDIFLQQKGVGYYKFRVRIISPYIEEYCNSEWSDFSPALDVKTIPVSVDNSLDDLLNDPSLTTAAGIRQAVQQTINTKDLKASLLTDQDNSETTAKLAALENMAGGPAGVSVTSAASAFDQNKVSIVGANLNNNGSENPDENPITLVLDKPAANHVIPERYDSAVAIKFSMTLDNVEDPENLKVPVKITLPVPDSINPEFLVILHYHENGEVELLEPYVYEVAGEYYADFVLMSFSDFAMTQWLQESEHVHVYDQEVVEDDYLEAPADCVHPAVYHKSCECGEMGPETFEYGEPEGHSFDGEDGTVCTKCGFRRYAITAGADQTYYKGCVFGLVFRSEARGFKFASVEVDHKVIDQRNYVLVGGSRSLGTVVMLKASYLNTLNPGEHVITIVSEDGEAETVFTISRRVNWPGHKGNPSWPDWF